MMHGVKNHFQVLNSLFELQLMDLKNEAATLAVQESLGRLRLVTLIYKNLSSLDFYQTVDFERVVIEIFNQMPKEKNIIDNAIKSSIHLPNLILNVDAAIPLGLILNELLMNSFVQKKKMETNREISIKLLESEDKTRCIEFMDTGIELAKGFDLNDSKLSFGMRMVNGLSRQIGGRTEIPNKPECRFRIFFH